MSDNEPIIFNEREENEDSFQLEKKDQSRISLFVFAVVGCFTLLAIFVFLNPSLIGMAPKHQKRAQKPSRSVAQISQKEKYWIIVEQNHRIFKGSLDFDDEDLEVASRKYSTVRRWDLAKTGVVHGLKYLEKVPVEMLILTDTYIDSKAIDDVCQLEHLNYLSLNSCYNLTTDDIRKLEKLPNLNTLLVSAGPHLDGQVSAELAKLKSLRTLVLHHFNFTKEQIADLRKLNLKSLSLDHVDMTTELVDTIARYRDLEHLRISNCELSAKDAKRLSQSRSINSVTLARVEIPAKALLLISELPKLKSLRVIGTQVDQGIKQKLKNKIGDSVKYEDCQ